MEVEICLTETRWYQKCCPIGQGFNFSYGCVDLDEKLKQNTTFPPEINHFYPVVTYPTCHFPTFISSAVSKVNDLIPTP